MATKDKTVKLAEYVGACVGMQYRSKTGVEEMVRDENCERKLKLVPEPSNKFNPRAVAVYYTQHHIGYIPDDKLQDAHQFLEWKGTVNVVKEESFITQAKLDPETNLPIWLEFGVEVSYVD